MRQMGGLRLLIASVALRLLLAVLSHLPGAAARGGASLRPGGSRRREPAEWMPATREQALVRAVS